MPPKLRSLLPLTLVFMARGAAALGAIGLSLVVGRVYGIKALGQFTVLISFLGIFTLLSRRGLDMLLTREIPKGVCAGREGRISGLVETAISTGFYTALALAIPGSALILSGLWGDQIQYSWVAFSICLPFLTALIIVSGYFRGGAKVWLFPLMQIGGVSFVAGIAIAIASKINATDDVNSLLFIFTLSCIFVCLIVAVLLFREKDMVTGDYRKVFLFPRWRDIKFSGEQISFTFIGASRYIIAAGSFIIIAPFISEVELGLVRISERLGLIVSFAVLVVNPFISASVVKLVQNKESVDLRNLILRYCVIGAAISTIPLLILLIVPGYVLNLLGPEFLAAKQYVRILALANYAVVLLGPFAVVLNMGGGERKLSFLSVIFAFVSIILYVSSSILWGGEGFVWSYAIIAVLYALAVIFFSLEHISSIS